MNNRNFLNNQGRGTGRLFLILAIVAAAAILLASTFVFIPPQTSGVVISLLAPGGYRKQPMQSGLHLLIPFAEHVEKYSVSRQTYTMSSAESEGQIIGDDSIRARTKDGQEVFVDASIIYSIDPSKVVQLHINWQNRYQDELIRPATRNAIRDAVSQYGVEEIVSTQRAEMEELVATELGKQFASNDLILISFLLRDIHFSEEYAAAIEQKQIAEQQAQQAKLVVEQRKQEAEQARQVAQGQADAAVIAAQGAAQARIVEAQAEAEALGLLAAALQDNPQLLQYQYINKLAPGVQTIFVPSGNQFILPLPTAAPTVAP
jgi:regulator of protease activity HflC (stomatin/prohibitin superfamily)